MRIREAVLLSAGLGTRMRPVTLGIPKPAIPFLNRPVVHWTLDSLAGAGVRRVFVNMHHLPDVVRKTAEAYSGDIEFLFFHETELLGTAGFLGPMRAHFAGEGFFVVNGDILHEIPYDVLAGDLLSHPGALATLALADGSRAYTGVSLAPRGTIRGFGEGSCMFTGVYAARREIIDHLEMPGRRELVPDLLGPLLPAGAVRGRVFAGLWEDLGSPSGFLAASMRALTRMARGGMDVPRESRLVDLSGWPVLMHETAKVHPSTICSGPAVLGEGVVLDSGTHIGASVLLPGTTLEAGRRIRSAILSPWGEIPVPADFSAAGADG